MLSCKQRTLGIPNNQHCTSTTPPLLISLPVTPLLHYYIITASLLHHYYITTGNIITYTLGGLACRSFRLEAASYEQSQVVEQCAKALAGIVPPPEVLTAEPAAAAQPAVTLTHSTSSAAQPSETHRTSALHILQQAQHSSITTAPQRLPPDVAAGLVSLACTMLCRMQPIPVNMLRYQVVVQAAMSLASHLRGDTWGLILQHPADASDRLPQGNYLGIYRYIGI